MSVYINESKFSDVVSTIGKGIAKGAKAVGKGLVGANKLAADIANKYDKIKKGDWGTDFSIKGSKKDIPDIIPDKDKDKMKVVGISKSGLIQVQFDGTKVSEKLVDMIMPNSPLYKYVVDYEDGTVTMDLPLNLKSNSADSSEDTPKSPGTSKVKISNKNRVKSNSGKRESYINESVDWEYFDKYDNIMDDYLPAQGEGDTLASQMVTAVTKIVYKYYNDGDVFDNTYYLDGFDNDLSSYANWLAKYVPKCNLILSGISSAKDESDYEDLLQKLTDYCFSDEVINKLASKDKEGSVYNCSGQYEFDPYKNEDDSDDEYYDDDWSEEYDDEDDEEYENVLFDETDSELELKENATANLNDTEWYAVDMALGLINTDYQDDIEGAVRYACDTAANGSAEPEYEDEYFYMEDCDYDKVLKYVMNNIKSKGSKQNMTEAMVPEGISEELLVELFNEMDLSYTRSGKEVSDVWLPWDTYEQFNEDDYYDNYGITEEQFDKTRDYLLDLLYDANYYKDGEVYLQLHDNSTLVDVTNYDLPDETYTEIVNDAVEELEAETGEDIYLLGRSGRHCCVEFTLDNLKNYAVLKEMALAAEKKVISRANNYDMEEESVMVPTPTPYKSKNRKSTEELELDESVCSLVEAYDEEEELAKELELDIDDEDEEDPSDKYNYRVTYKNGNEYDEELVSAKNAKEAIDNFKKDNIGEIMQVTNDSFTDRKTYYKDGWSEVKEGNLRESYLDSSYNCYDVESFKELEIKTIEDEDGFNTDYTLYECYMEDGSTLYVCIYGDAELYDPTNSDFDYESDDVYNAYDWFASYGDEKYEGLSEGRKGYDTVDKLDEWLTGAFFEYMIEQGGFENDKEVDLYLNPHIDITKEDDGRTKVQFRYEAPDYDSQIDVANVLSTIVEHYDEEAYFDLYSYGVLEAWIDYPFVYKREEALQLNIDDTLLETQGLELSDPVVDYQNGHDEEGIALTIEVNGKKYRYITKHDSKLSPSEVADKVRKIQKYSDGRALAYLKKNMVLSPKQESLKEELSKDDTEIIQTINDVYKEKGDIESSEAIIDITSKLKDKNIDVDDEYLSDMIIKSLEMIDQLGESYLNEDYELTPGKEFTSKSGHKLKVIKVVPYISEYDGHTILDIDYEYETTDGDKGTSRCHSKDFFNMLRESINVGDRVSHVDDSEPRQVGIVRRIKNGTALVDFLNTEGKEDSVEAPVDKLQKEWTQVSNIGQHKVDSIDLVEDAEEAGEKTYTITLDNGSEAQVTADNLIKALQKFRRDDSDSRIISMFKEESLKESLNTYVVNFDEDRKYIVHGVDEKDAKEQFGVLYPTYKKINSVELIREGDMITEGNSFKDHHICQGCGNPLSKCTCPIEGLDEGE